MKPIVMPLIQVQINRSGRAGAELIEALERTFATADVTEVEPLMKHGDKNENLESQSDQQTALRAAR